MAITIKVSEIGDYAWRQSEKLLRAAVAGDRWHVEAGQPC
jgi:hypothetical protein